MKPINLENIISEREKRLARIAGSLGRNTSNSSLDWRAVFDNAYTDGEMMAKFNRVDEINF